MANQQPRDLLYNDGYISRMSGALGAAQYFTRLLQFDERRLQLIFPRGPGAFFIIGPTVQNAQPIYIAGRPAWLLEYILRNYGTVVPQRIWAPANAADARRFCNVLLNMPIFFVRDDGRALGLKLVEAALGNCAGLRNAHAPAPIGDCHTTSIRLNWHGYGEQSAQIMTKDQRPERNTINLHTLAERVARAVRKFLEIFARQQCQHPAWRVGYGGITEKEVILIGLIHVTQGSWQPILQLNRYIL